jgi:hypothetical protein
MISVITKISTTELVIPVQTIVLRGSGNLPQIARRRVQMRLNVAQLSISAVESPEVNTFTADETTL